MYRLKAHGDDCVPFCTAYDFFLGERLPAMHEMTTWVLVCDLVAVGQVHMPSPSDLWSTLAKSYKGMASKAILRTLGVLPKPSDLSAEENSRAFEQLFKEVRGRLDHDAERLLPDIIHFEHALCKLQRFHHDHPGVVIGWASDARQASSRPSK